MKFKNSVVALLLICFAGSTQAATDLSGTWVFNGKKGENLGMMAALEETLVVAQTSEQLTVDFTDVFRGNTTTRQVKLDLTGTVIDNLAAMGGKSKTKSTWDGEKLVTTWTSVNGVGAEVIRTETHELIDGGAGLSVTSERANKPNMVMVYEKQ
jgi:hypothetical protein